MQHSFSILTRLEVEYVVNEAAKTGKGNREKAFSPAREKRQASQEQDPARKRSGKSKIF